MSYLQDLRSALQPVLFSCLSDIPHRPFTRIAFIFVLPFAVFWGLLLLHNLLISPVRKVPGPFWARLTRWWEYRALVKGDSHLLYIHLHEKYGPIVRVGPSRYSVSQHKDVKAIYELGGKFTKGEYYSPVELPDPDKTNIFTIRDNDYHKERRRKIASLYTMSSMVAYEDAVDKMNSVCIRKMHQFADEKRLFSVPQFMQYYAFDVIGEITFNQSFGMMENEGDTTGMVAGIHRLNDYLAHMGLVPDLHPWVSWVNFLMGRGSSAATVINYALAQIAKHREENANPTKDTKYDTFLKKLINLEAENRIAMSNMLDACSSNIGAGSDTTAITLSSAIYYLYNHPEKLVKLRQEIDTHVAEGRISDPVTFQEAQGMPFLQAVIKETLRLHPAVGTILPRKVPKGGVELGGILFPEGTEVGANAWVLHYSKDIYGPDAHEYRPERWLESEKSSLKDSMMFAFGAGSRTCIGKNISLLEITKVLPQIVRNFDIKVENVTERLDARCAWFVYPKYQARVQLRESP